MTSVQPEQTSAAPPPPPPVPRNYLNADYSVWSWLTTTDHKRIALLYLFSILFFFVVGSVGAIAIRLNLLTPDGFLLKPQTYNKMFSMHGISMVFLFLVPSVPATLGNFLVPLMVGAKDLAFPRINLATWYIFMTGGLLILLAFLTGGVDTGWTFYTPYSSLYSNTNVTLAALGVFFVGFSTVLTGLNFVITIHKLRAPGLTWFRLPLFLWSMYATSVIMILATPVLAITFVLVVLERALGIGIFDPKLGGDPILFQHFFWFYSHPAVYIMILPGMGIMSEVVPCFARKNIYGYIFVAFASLAIALFGFLVWGHHMFVSGQSVYAGMVFSALSMIVAIPSAVKVFNWTATLYKGSISFDTPMLYALGFIGLFTLGGLTGIFLATLPVDVHVTKTYFVIAHFHFIMVGGYVMAFAAGVHFWWPKITGRIYPEMAGRVAALITFIGFNLTFFPQFIAGYAGMPRRYAAYPAEYQVWQVMSTAGASILLLGYLLPAVYLLWSLKYGRRAGANPWHATGLEWKTPSPPPPHNFEVTPMVTTAPYDYAHQDYRDEEIQP